MTDIVQNIEAGAQTIGTDLQAFLTAAGNLIAAGVSTIATAQKLVALTASVIEKGNPEQADWDTLHAILDANTAALNAPLAP